MSDQQTSYYEFWLETAKRIQETLPPQEFSTWFSRISYLSSKKGEVTLAGPSQFVLDTVTTRYRSIIANTLSELTGEEIAVEFVVSDKGKKAVRPMDGDETAEEARKEKKPMILPRRFPSGKARRI